MGGEYAGDADLPLVLIVDDNDRNRKLARDVLARGPVSDARGRDGRGGIALASEHLPDVVLMDLRLPDADGTQAAPSAQGGAADLAHPGRGRDRPAAPGARRWVSEAGFAGYIAKPIDIDELPTLSAASPPARPVRPAAARSRAVAPPGVPASPGTCRQAWLAGGRPSVTFPVSDCGPTRAAGGRDTGGPIHGTQALRSTESKLALAIALVVLGLAAYAGNVLATPRRGFVGRRSRRRPSATSSRTCTARPRSPGTKSSGRRVVRPLRPAEHVAARWQAPAGTRIRARAS